METLVIQAELALDHLKEPDSAEKYLEKMKEAAQDDSDKSLLHYVEGRILLFRGDFTMARVDFTRSHRISESGEIADKSRYYLGLGDFYNEEFDYSRLQLRSLERQNHSWFANNALQLRYMIQQAWEENGDNKPLRRYARARYLYDSGHYAKSAELLAPVLDESWQHPLHNESILLLTRVLRRIHPEIAFQVIDRHTRRPSVRQHAGEQLLWERARLAEQVYMMHHLPDDTEGMLTYTPPSGLVEHIFGDIQHFSGLSAEPVLLTADTIIGYYEDLLMNYSDGYYSDISRNRIRELEQKSREI